MLRKLIMLAIGAMIFKKLYAESRSPQMRAPFPTSGRPPEGWQPEV